MTFYAASYYPRYGDALGTFVSLKPGLAEEAADRAAEWVRGDLPSYCEDPHCDGHCCFCDPDIIAGMEFRYPARHLFTADSLRKHRRALMEGKVIVL